MHDGYCRSTCGYCGQNLTALALTLPCFIDGTPATAATNPRPLDAPPANDSSAGTATVASIQGEPSASSPGLPPSNSSVNPVSFPAPSLDDHESLCFRFPLTIS